MMTVFIKLIIAGADTGPFDLYSDVDAFVTTFDTDIPRQSLVDGYLCATVPDSTTRIKIQSTGEDCDNFIIVDITMTQEPTTTTTTTHVCPSCPTTTTTTTELIEQFNLVYDVYASDCENSCPYSYGEILVNGTPIKTWTPATVLPLNGTVAVNTGSTVVINDTCYSSGSGCVDTQATLLLLVNSIEVADSVDGLLTYSFTLTEASHIELILSCIIPAP
jgi:hypothetical protein